MTNGFPNNNEKRPLNGGPIQSEKIAFEPDEMLACPGCSRRNPPNRLNCFYCGRELEIIPKKAVLVRPVLRHLESWEKGHNLVYLGRRRPNESELAKAANLAGTFMRVPMTVLPLVVEMPSDLR